MFTKLFIIALPVFFFFDMIWLGFVTKNFYKAQIGTLMRTDINWTAAVIFYFIFIVGLVIFVIMPAIEKGSWIQAITLGALFGLVCYATYDLTNLAIAKDWPIIVTIVDLIWGTMVTSLVSIITYFVANRIGL